MFEEKKEERSSTMGILRAYVTLESDPLLRAEEERRLEMIRQIKEGKFHIR